MRIGGGSGNGGTNWAGMSVADMWLAIGNQDTTAHWELLTGWRKSYELTQQHMAAVRSYRDNLAAAWPPDKSPAAAAYVAQLDALLAHLQQTYDAAVANYTAFNGATLALSSARRDLEKVYAEYVSNEGRLAGFEEERAHRPVAVGKGAVPPLKPPVEEGRQAELESRARSIMYGLSSEIIQARAQVVQPVKFDPRRHIAEDQERATDTYTAPDIPAVIPFTPERPSPASQSQPTVQAADPLVNQSGSSVPSASRQPGLILGGANPPAATPQPPSLPPSATADGVHPTAVSPAPLTPLLPPHRRQPPMPPIPPRSGSLVVGQPIGSAAQPSRAMPPGGVIGATPLGISQPAPGTRAPSSVNPIGGVLGQNNQALSRPITPIAGQPFATSAARNKDQRPDSASVVRWDPDNPWAVASGVNPVVLPPPEQRVDPGPAIGLS